MENLGGRVALGVGLLSFLLNLKKKQLYKMEALNGSVSAAVPPLCGLLML